MCGRFVSSSAPDEVAKYFGATAMGEKLLEPNYNVAPTTSVHAVRSDGSVRSLDALHWGLVPIWAKDIKIGNRMINARSETAAEKNAFRRALKKRRCIIPADGFYEWTVVPGQKKKQPMFIHRPDGDPFAFAGLWEIWRGPDRDGTEELHSCTILTGAANEPMAEVHDRMPIMVPPSLWDAWLDPEIDDLDLFAEVFQPAPAQLIAMHPVSTEVNNARNKGAHLIDEVPIGDEGLFAE